MTNKSKYMEKFNEHFNALPKDVYETGILRIKSTNDIPEDEDISGVLPQLVTQDMLFDTVDNVFKVDHVLSDLIENGIPHKHIEQLDLDKEQAKVFHAGVVLAHMLFSNIMFQSHSIEAFVNTVRELNEEE